MNKILKPLLLAIILCIVIIREASAQKKNYRALVWNNTDIAILLKKPDVKYFEFNFNKPFLKAYKISVTAFDKYGKIVGYSPLGFYRPPGKISLENSYADGLLTMSEKEVKTHSNNGTKSLYFIPVPYDEKHPELPYVSYEVYNEEPGPVPKHDLYVTTIKPSPPYGK